MLMGFFSPLFSNIVINSISIDLAYVYSLIVYENVYLFYYRGPEMLVAFHSSPFSAPLQSGVPNRGFELDVDILFADSDSYDFAQGQNNKCEFHINATKPGE